MLSIDLNCDMGESFGAWPMGNDEAMMDLVSSVNIACGFHAGDVSVMRRTVALALKKGVSIGAHPGYPDLQGFGRREMKLTPANVYEIVVYQVSALSGFVRAAGGSLHHVKPHGALYNTAAKDIAVANAIARAIRGVDKSLALVGLSGSCLIEQAEKAGLRSVSEGFADRTYQEDGSLTPRHATGAVIEDSATSAQRVLQMVTEKAVTAVSGVTIPVNAETICIHGDGKFAHDHARAIVNVLTENGIAIKSF